MKARTAFKLESFWVFGPIWVWAIPPDIELVGEGNENKNQRGASLVEFAMIAPFLIILILGLTHFGILMYRMQGLHAAAREGARTASISGSTNQDIETSINNALEGVAANGITITITPALTGSNQSPCEGRKGEEVKVELETSYDLDVPFLTGQTIDIGGKGSFRCEA